MTYDVYYTVTLGGAMYVDAVNPKEATRKLERMGIDELCYYADTVVSVDAEIRDEADDEPDVDERQERFDFAKDEDY